MVRQYFFRRFINSLTESFPDKKKYISSKKYKKKIKNNYYLTLQKMKKHLIYLKGFRLFIFLKGKHFFPKNTKQILLLTKKIKILQKYLTKSYQSYNINYYIESLQNFKKKKFTKSVNINTSFSIILKYIFKYKLLFINQYLDLNKNNAHLKKLKINYNFFLKYQMIQFLNSFNKILIKKKYKSLIIQKNTLMIEKKYEYLKQTINSSIWQLSGVRMCFSGRTKKRNLMSQVRWLNYGLFLLIHFPVK